MARKKTSISGQNTRIYSRFLHTVKTSLLRSAPSLDDFAPNVRPQTEIKLHFRAPSPSCKVSLLKVPIVIVKEDTLPRNCWQLARVSKTYSSEDGYIRSVQVDLGDAALPADGKRKGPVRRLDRPVNKLVLLVPRDADADEV